MNPIIGAKPTRHISMPVIAGILVMAGGPLVTAGEISAGAFKFDGPLGNHGATVEKVASNHFKISLGHAPEHPDWCNMPYFQIVRGARGNPLRVDVEFTGGESYRFNNNSITWSHDGGTWLPARWCDPDAPSKKGDSLLFSKFSQDTVYVGAQVPMSYEDVVKLMETWSRHPDARTHILGESLGGRNIYRLEVGDSKSPHPESARWAHWFGNQHPGEHNSQWRMAGMVDWLLSEEGVDCRRRTVCHFVLMTSPDGPSNGWYRVNAQGVDMNRSYFSEGADPDKQAHEACIVQKDLEKLMASKAPPSSVWSMHTWLGPVEPIMVCGPEIGSSLGTWEEFRDILLKNAPADLIEPLKLSTKAGNPTQWNHGPHIQFGVTNVLCEGAGDWTSKQRSLDAGAALMKSIGEYYKGLRKE